MRLIWNGVVGQLWTMTPSLVRTAASRQRGDRVDDVLEQLLENTRAEWSMNVVDELLGRNGQHLMVRSDQRGHVAGDCIVFLEAVPAGSSAAMSKPHVEGRCSSDQAQHRPR